MFIDSKFLLYIIGGLLAIAIVLFVMGAFESFLGPSVTVNTA